MSNMAPPPAATWPDVTDRRHLDGTARIRRTAWLPTPRYELVDSEGVVASLGRLGWLAIFFGRGQRVDFPNGDKWRIRSISIGPTVCPVIIDSEGRKVAIAGLGNGTYGINGKDYAASLVPDDARSGRSNRWSLRHHESAMANVIRRPLSIMTIEPIPLGAALLSLVVVRFGIVGESAPNFPEFRWN